MVLGSPLSGSAATTNGSASMAQQGGSRLSQMQDSFRKQMLQNKERAKVSPTGAVRSPSNRASETPGKLTNASVHKTPTKQVEEERKPLRQTQRTAPPQSASRQPRAAQDENAATKKASSSPIKQQHPSSSNAARPKSSPKSSLSSVSSPASQSPKTSLQMKKGPTPPSAAATDMPSCHNCGRHFAQDRLAKHEEICIKTSKKKRKVFDPTKMRVKGTEAESYLKNASKRPAKVQEPPKRDWRRQHEDFIRSIRDAKAAQAHVAAGGKLSDLPPPPPMDTSHLTPCPHCGRKFNETAAQRHIPRCKDMQHKPKPPPSLRGSTPGKSGTKPTTRR